MRITLTNQDLSTVCSALDSYIYWELSDRQYRNSGYVEEPGSDDPDSAAEIAAATKLLIRLERLSNRASRQPDAQTSAH